MATEIERKFLVRGMPWQDLGLEGSKYTQGYLSTDPTRVVRVRLCENTCTQNAFITIKSSLSPLSATEYEYAIPPKEACAMLETLAEKPLIEKIRYHIPYDSKVWHVDCFFGDNAGLVTAEIELEYEEQTFTSPPWLGEEITHDMRYKNAQLVRNPFSNW